MDVVRKEGARVKHIILRLDVLTWSEIEPEYANKVAAMDRAMASFPDLLTVTLETNDARESAELVDEFPSLRGRLRQRTCEEARKIAEKAKRTPEFVKDTTVSSIWYSESINDSRWCVEAQPPYTFELTTYRRGRAYRRGSDLKRLEVFLQRSIIQRRATQRSQQYSTHSAISSRNQHLFDLQAVSRSPAARPRLYTL